MTGSMAYRRAAALLVAAGAVALTAACGGGAGDSATGGGNGGRDAAFTAYSECLGRNGVTITMPSGGPRNRPSYGPRPSGRPRPSGSADLPGGGRGFGGGGFMGKPPGVDDATWQKAQEACSSLRPSFGPGGGNRGNGRDSAYRNCLKENGVTDPSKPDPGDATAKKAIETCKVLKPTA